MKIQHIIRRLISLFFVIVIVGCVRSTEDVTSSSTPTPAMRASSVSQTPVATGIPTASPTTIPILPVEDARKRLLELLATNGDCHLPCLWGITPGESTYQEAQIIFAPLSSISDLTSFSLNGGAIFPVYTEGDTLLDIDTGFNIDPLSNNQIVNRVGFRARELKKIITTDNGLGFDLIFDSSLFGERLNFYMLHSVLENYGRPESVLLGTVASIPPREPAGGFHILLIYPDQGILIDYTTQMHKTGSYVSGCPANAHVEMDLYPPGDADSFFALLEKTGGDDWAVKKNWYQPLEETTSMSVEEFYETFREPTDKCIETLASLWPTPDP